MADFFLRPAAFADLPVITAIYAEAVLIGTATFETEPPDEAEMERRMKALFEGGFPYFVAEAGGIVLGYGYAGRYRERIAYRNTVEDSIYLAPESRGRGIGAALLKGLVEECERLDFRQIVAVIGDSANEPSIRVHRSAGFDLIGTFRDVGFKHGRWLDTVLMQKTLGTGGSAPPSR
jgi:phosphinothricin acetyltransferase